MFKLKLIKFNRKVNNHNKQFQINLKWYILKKIKFIQKITMIKTLKM